MALAGWPLGLNAPEQFVSPPDKPKLLLKVELKKPAADGTASYIFEFGGPHGDKNRNAVKEAILQSVRAWVVMRVGRWAQR